MNDRMRNLPNVISVARMCTVPILVWLAHQGESEMFIGLTAVAWLSDGLDGWLARRWGWVSRLGAVLDSVADVALIGATLYGIDRFHPAVFREHGAVLLGVVGVWTCVHLGALFRYRRTASFHTPLARAGIVLYVVFVLVLFTFGFVAWLYYACGVLCLIAGLENLALVCLVQDWNPDARGGLWAVLWGGRGADRSTGR